MDPYDLAREDVDVERLAENLKALAHPARLEILWRLRIPATSSEIVVRPRRRDADLSPDRPMTRQSIDAHLATLEEAGVVGRHGEAEGGAPRWITSNQLLFALIEDLRKLTAIRPAERVDVDATIRADAAAAAAPEWPAGPKLVLASGPWEGRAFPLAGAGPWTVGRSRSAHVALAYDPFASAEHAVLDRAGAAWRVTPATSTRNPTRVNFAPLAPGIGRALAPGDVITVGRSLLVFQPS